VNRDTSKIALQTRRSRSFHETRRRRLALERLERREVFAAEAPWMPFGALPQDTGEFFLGRVAVTPVLLESNGNIDANIENWHSEEIQVVLDRVQQGMQWWVDLLAEQDSVHSLEFVFDTQYATNPFPTPYEPISRISNDYTRWVQQFLTDVNFNTPGGLESDMRAFNHAQRERLKANWAYTIFVVDAELDPDGGFADGGDFSRAFAFAGGLFQVVPSERPTSTYTHETGHMFWARDEYPGGGNWTQTRGYYNSQNLNAWDNPSPGFVQQPSIMAAGTLLTQAFDELISPAVTVAQLGWQDSDGDGIFDVLDVPLLLEGTGTLDPAQNRFQFIGSAAVQTLPNLNSSGLRNDITLNQLSELQFRIDGGPWQTALELNQYTATLDVQFDVPENYTSLTLRVIDRATGVSSAELTVPRAEARRMTRSGARGVVWVDEAKNGVWDAADLGLANAELRIVDPSGQPVSLMRTVEPDDYPAGQLPSIPGVQLIAVGPSTDGRVGAFDSNRVSTGTKAFRFFGTDSNSWLQSFSGLRQLRVNFTEPTTAVEIDAIGLSSASAYGRINAYDASGNLIARDTTDALSLSGVGKLRVESVTGEIAYVIVGGHLGSSVALDNLRWGAASTSTSDGLGGFALPALPDGTYTVQLVTNNPSVLIADGDRRSVSIVDGIATSDLSFRVVPANSRYQNPNDRLDVEPNGLVEALDALIVINELNRGRGPDLESDTRPAPPFVDVDGNNRLEPLDALLVINHLNRQGSGSGEGERGGDGGSGNLSSLISQPTAPNVPSTDAMFATLTLADYLAAWQGDFEDSAFNRWGLRRRR